MAGIGKKLNSSKVIAIIALVVAVASIGFATLQYSETQKLKTAEGQKQVADDEAKALKAKVSKLMQLPDENPTVATIQDISKLKDQAFFDDAKNGDKVLIFTEAKKAIIYRESENKIINSGPIAVTSDNKASSTIAVSVLASKGGSSADAKAKVTGIQNVKVTEGKAVSSYSSTKVVDVSGKNAAKAKEIADALGGEVDSSVPSGESAPAGAAIVVFAKR